MAIKGRWSPDRYPKPTKWTRGFVSRAQARRFDKDSSLARYRGGMWANTPGGSTFKNPVSRRAKLKGLPERKRKKK